jgi:DMSO/TMAO reductase YedYZ heme-binding membrane subunit
VKKLEYWKISALIGAIIFLASGFLPFISAGGGVASSPLTDIYNGLGLGMDWGTVFSTLPMFGVGWLLAMILYPVTVVLGLASFLRRKLALFAGILGIICGIGEIMMISGLQSLLAEFGGAIEYGYGIFVGFAGAIIMLAANYIKGGTVPPTPTAPPPPPPT